MLEVDLNESIVNLAKIEARHLGKLHNSIMSGESNVYGILGELMVSKYFKVGRENTYDYDIILFNKRIDVKTKRCTSKPISNYECSIANYNIKQECDLYLFVRVLENFKKGWILGYIPKTEYFIKARKYLKGDSQGKFRFHCDTYNLSISQLFDVKSLYNVV